MEKFRINLNLTINEVDILITELEAIQDYIDDDDTELNNERIKVTNYLIKKLHRAYFKN
jgi:hypothetical protein